MKFGVISLGCDKNRVDSEKVIAKLLSQGYSLSTNEDDADILIVNTCVFIDDAKRESIDTIIDLGKKKALKSNLIIIVIRCLAERYGTQIAQDLPEVDCFIGLGAYDQIDTFIKRKLASSSIESGDAKYNNESLAQEENFNTKVIISKDKEGEYSINRTLSTPNHYAYLKISDGCNNFCSYCAIPYIRGRYRSYPIEKLISEAQELVDDGVKELIIVAQDTTKYGIDLYSKHKLTTLLKELCKLDLYKIRVLYAYPELVTDELIDLIAFEDKMAKYIDMPLQHFNNEILTKMNRHVNSNQIQNLIEKIRKANSKICIRSSFIVGFPGETNQQFEDLKAFIKSGNIDYAGFFKYSQEEGTVAAKYINQVPERVKKKREKELVTIQSKIIVNKHKKYQNAVQKVMYEGIDFEKNLFYGRNEFNAPDVDTKVFFSANRTLNIGQVYDVHITNYGFHLLGEVMD
jgi:ribosomal protein S12 methylthiotransferase